MKNENSNGTPSAEQFLAHADLVAATELAEEVDFRTRQFLRAYSSPATNVGTVVDRARVLLDVVGGLSEFLKLLIEEKHGK